MLANITRVSVKNASTAHGTVAEQFFAAEINFLDRLFGFSFCLWFRVTLLEFEADILFVRQHEKCFEGSALARNEALKQICFPGRQQFLHLFALDWPLQYHFARSEIARLIGAD